MYHHNKKRKGGKERNPRPTSSGEVVQERKTEKKTDFAYKIVPDTEAAVHIVFDNFFGGGKMKKFLGFLIGLTVAVAVAIAIAKALGGGDDYLDLEL